MSSILPLVLSSTAILLTGITAIFSVLAYAKVVGMEKSTHQISWEPIKVEEGETPQNAKDLMKGLAPEGYKFYDKEGFEEK